MAISDLTSSSGTDLQVPPSRFFFLRSSPDLHSHSHLSSDKISTKGGWEVCTSPMVATLCHQPSAGHLLAEAIPLFCNQKLYGCVHKCPVSIVKSQPLKGKIQILHHDTPCRYIHTSYMVGILNPLQMIVFHEKLWTFFGASPCMTTPKPWIHVAATNSFR